METDVSTDPPADAVRYAKNLYLSRAAEPKLSVLKRIMAVLNVDLGPNAAVFGERSAGEGQARQMLFNAGAYGVDLRIKKTAGKGFNVKGQVIGDGFASAEIKITNAENTYVERANELGEFKFENIAEGKYILASIGNDKELVIENLEIN